MARSGGGINSNKVAHYQDRKAEPVVHGVSQGAVSRLGGMVGPGTPHKAIYNQQAYTNPIGPTPSVAGPGGGRMVLPHGTQAPCKPPTPMGTSRKF
jgi:hypothetical protein